MQANTDRKRRGDYDVGQTVRLQEVPSQGRNARKLSKAYDGPYQIMAREGNEYTIQKVGEGTKVKFRVHADRLGPYNDLMELDTRQANRCGQDDEEKEDYEVEEIVDDTGSRAAGNKKYLVRWKGYGAEDGGTRSTLCRQASNI